MTKIARTLSLLVAFAVMAACASKPSARLDSLKTPHSPLQLVEAIWQLSASSQILDSSLYTVDNLKRAFGGSDVELQVGKYDVLIGSYWAKISNFPFGTPSPNGIRLNVSRLTMHPDGELKASVRLDFDRLSTDIDLAAVERRFGRSWVEKEYPLPIPGPPQQVIVYKFGDERSGWATSFVFERNGTLGTMFVDVNRPKQ